MDLLLAYYGDDFTGSTDVMESLTRGGVETVLFVEPPTEAMLQQFAHVRAVGIAGNSRTMSPEQMEAALPAAFQALAALRPKIVHYKVCSTFDSSPRIGSIGRAIDIGQRVFHNRFVPLVIGAPVLQRFCVFGNLFARSGLDSVPYRLDRHPTMSQHPVTPMNEADLRAHLLRQTDRPMVLVDVLALDQGPDAVAEQLALAARNKDAVVLFDTLSDDHLATIGHAIWQTAQEEHKPLFVAGSSGVEYALAQHWQVAGIETDDKHDAKSQAPQPVDRVVVVSGSCSPVTERQIAWALEHGFVEVPIDAGRLLSSPRAETEIEEVAGRIKSDYDQGRSVIVHTSRGPHDARIAAARQAAGDSHQAAARLAAALGDILHNTLATCDLRRVAVAGGDTAGEVARRLGIEALEMVGPLEPGAPLCVARSQRAEIDGIEFTFKGGQVGHDDFFHTLLTGSRKD